MLRKLLKIWKQRVKVSRGACQRFSGTLFNKAIEVHLFKDNFGITHRMCNSLMSSVQFSGFQDFQSYAAINTIHLGTFSSLPKEVCPPSLPVLQRSRPFPNAFLGGL